MDEFVLWWVADLDQGGLPLPFLSPTVWPVVVVVVVVVQFSNSQTTNQRQHQTTTSNNQVICHGIPDETVLKEGDIINVDVTVFFKGFHGDCSETFVVRFLNIWCLIQLLFGWRKNYTHTHCVVIKNVLWCVCIRPFSFFFLSFDFNTLLFIFCPSVDYFFEFNHLFIFLASSSSFTASQVGPPSSVDEAGLNLIQVVGSTQW